MYKIIFLDIDGTVLRSDHHISRGTQATIERINKTNNIPVILTSARPPKAIAPIYSELGLNAPVVCFNGALIIQDINENEFEVLSSLVIKTTILYEINRIISGYQHITANFYTADQWLIHNYDEKIRREEQITGTKATLISSDRLADRWNNQNNGPHKILLMGNPAELDSLTAELTSHYNNEISIYKSKTDYLEITNNKASKKSAIQFLSGKANINPPEILAIGDGYNDIEMLQYAGMGIAMGNAPEAVKQAANFITASNDEEGIKLALDKYIP